MRKVIGAIALTWGVGVAVFSGNRYRLGGVALLAILATVVASTRVGHAVPITTDDYGSTAPIVVHRLVVGGLASGGAEPALVFGAASPLAADGLFSYPLASWGGVTDRFGIPRARGKVHTGLDLGLSEPVTVYAACDGVVTVAAQSEIAEGEGYGKYIVIQCDRDWSTLYAHLSRTVVEVGQEVVKGWPIALSGSTGFSTGQHLHFEIRYRGVFTDPVRYLNFGRLPRVSPAVGELRFLDGHDFRSGPTGMIQRAVGGAGIHDDQLVVRTPNKGRQDPRERVGGVERADDDAEGRSGRRIHAGRRIERNVRENCNLRPRNDV